MVFYRKLDPETREPIRNPDNYAVVKMNPDDNRENLPEEYFDALESLSARGRRRFLEGRYADATPGQLFSEDDIEKWRIMDADRLPDFVRVVIGVDPSGADDEDNAENDEIGIVAGALGVDGRAYLLEDLTVKAGPAVWGRVATSAYHRHSGDCVVAEINYGGAMVRQTIKVADPNVPYRKVTASRGKVQRAEPFSALYEQGKVRHVGRFNKLEDELTAFSTVGYLGDQSPNRADAWIWVLAELFSGLVKPKPKPRTARRSGGNYIPGGHGWMR
jgi:phage terminase large subunit-like protein